MPEFDALVDKQDLLTKLRENRDTHRSLFEKAFEGYRKMMIDDLEKRLADLKAGKPIDPWLRHTAPEDHTEDYNDAIEMLEWSKDEHIRLTQSQFQQYVKDNWGWKATWTSSNTAYLTA